MLQFPLLLSFFRLTAFGRRRSAASAAGVGALLVLIHAVYAHDVLLFLAQCLTVLLFFLFRPGCEQGFERAARAGDERAQ